MEKKLLMIAYLGQKLFAEHFRPDYIGGYTYKYDKNIFTDEQLEFLRQFEGMTLDMFFIKPTTFEAYDKTIVVKEEAEVIFIADTFRRVLHHYLSYILRAELNEFLVTIENNDFLRSFGFGISSDNNILKVYDVESFINYLKKHLKNYTIVEKILAIRRYWVINGDHHEIYKYMLRESSELSIFNFQNFPKL